MTFPDDPHFLAKIQEVADRAVKELEGDDEVQVEAHLYKLLFYETGGHFKAHRDTEKEPGMFATLIVQLPTVGGYKGGKVVIKQETWSCAYNAGSLELDHQSLSSSTEFYYTAFFADCRHTLEKVKAGTRLCLSFNLVRKNSNRPWNMAQILHSPMFEKVEDVLRPWLEAVEEDDAANSKVFPRILAIPLQHKYTPRNLSFSRLKGEDVTLFQVLANCLDRRLDLHLCLVTKHEIGEPVDHNGHCKKYRAMWTKECSEARGQRAGRCFTMGHVEEEEMEATNWVDLDDERLPIFPWCLDTETEVVQGKDEGLFLEGTDPDELQYEGYMGNEGPTLEYFYHRAMVVVWPKTKTVPTIIAERRPNNLYFASTVPEDAEVLSLLRMVERLQKDKDQHAHLVLSQLLAHCVRKYDGIWGEHDSYEEAYLEDSNGESLLDKLQNLKEWDGRQNKAKCVSSRLLDMCVVAGDLADVLKVLQLLSEVFQKRGAFHRVPWSIGLRSKFVSKSIAAAVHAHGWTACGHAVLLLLKKDRVLDEAEFYGQLVMELQELGHHKEAFLVANKAFELVSTSMTPTQCPELFKLFVKLILAMSEECLKELGSKFLQWLGPTPEFTWCQPSAHLPDHPAVEAFLKGPRESFTYHNLDSLLEARKLAQSFDGRFKNGYCATAIEGGRGARAHCVIKKSRDGFQYVLQNWKQQQEEASELKHRLQESARTGEKKKKKVKVDGTKTSDTRVEVGLGEKNLRGSGGSK